MGAIRSMLTRSLSEVEEIDMFIISMRFDLAQRAMLHFLSPSFFYSSMVLSDFLFGFNRLASLRHL